ncbi:unnamed protein product [Ceratitis capitata]|uniref:(Mediterranean fruit fly) hypothetical protein n=1 Tax=Ceratitis capitata TaxID=7213 RepID=A0A811VIN3_CERCA|nr:unnamed protein product [Ceratitis capitata]
MHGHRLVSTTVFGWCQSPKKIGELAGEITNLKLSLTAIEQRVSVVEYSCAKVSSLDGEPAAQLKELQSSAVATDIIINGILQSAGENLANVFEKLCSDVNHKKLPIRDAFRLRNVKDKVRNNNNHAPIVVELFSLPDRAQLFKSIYSLCKSRNKFLSLSDVDQPGYGKVYVHESLPRV